MTVKIHYFSHFSSSLFSLETEGVEGRQSYSPIRRRECLVRSDLSPLLCLLDTLYSSSSLLSLLSLPTLLRPKQQVYNLTRMFYSNLNPENFTPKLKIQITA